MAITALIFYLIIIIIVEIYTMKEIHCKLEICLYSVILVRYIKHISFKIYEMITTSLAYFPVYYWIQ